MTLGVFALSHFPGTDVAAGQSQKIGMVKETFTRLLVGVAKTLVYEGFTGGGTIFANTAGASVTDTMINLSGGAIASGGATATQYGVKLAGFATATGATV